MRKLIFIVLFAFSTLLSSAQYSIITRLDFYKAYLDVPIVKKASLANGHLTSEMLDYIFKKTNPAEVKYAIINALAFECKMSTNMEANNNVVNKYLDDNFQSLNSFDKILDVFGVPTAMSIAYLRTSINIYDDVAFENAKNAQKVNNDIMNIPSDATSIIYYLIAMEYSMGFVGDCTPMGTQEGFYGPLKDLMALCQSSPRDMRSTAVSKIQIFFAEYDHPMGMIKFVSKSFNPYNIMVNGEQVLTIQGKDTYEYWVSPGYYHTKAVQVSGYLFSPSIYDKDINLSDGEIFEVQFGY